MFEGDAELLHDFVVESSEGLSEIEADLLAIESHGTASDTDLVNKVFRAIHSIKGAAGFLALSQIETLAHSLENVLSLIRSQTLVPTSPVVDRLLKGADLLRRMICDVANSNNYDVSEHVAALKAIAAGEVPTTSATASTAEVELLIPPEELTACARLGQFAYLYDIDPALDRQARQPDEFLRRLADTGRILACSLTADLSAAIAGGEPQRFRVAHATALTTEQVAQFFELPAVRIRALTLADGDALPTEDLPAATPVDEAPPPSAVREPAVATDDHGEKKSQAADASIRVSVAVLDRLMNFAGELVLGRNQLMQTIANGDRRMLESVANRISLVTTELQEAIMQTRMQPVGNVLTKFNRVVRDMCKTLGKQAQLIIDGKDVELDKSIIESLGDPLTHLVRNALDHGLETPEVRERLGKSPQGTIHLRALHQEGKVLLVISDDGAGIDAAKLRRMAVEKGVITAEAAQAMSDREALQLIFAPGFSTAEKVTAVSGRGVGMDVVKTNFERLGGTVEIETVLGRGTTITVRLPLTLAIIPSLIASCGGQRYAIPQGNIRELVRVRPDTRKDMLGRVNRSEVLRLRGELVPLVRLRDLLGGTVDQPHEDQGVTNIVLVETGRMQYGIVVDHLHDSEEIVVKPLGQHLKGITFLAGATVLGDGRIALILDAGGIARRMNLNITQEDLAGHHQTLDQAGQAHEQIPTLLFANHPQERFGVPMTVVARIERIQAQQIDTIAGQQVLQYRGGTLTLLSLDRCIQARKAPDAERLYVVVFRHGGREIGLIAPQILDIRNLPAEMDTAMFREPGVLGSAVLDGHAVRFLDVFELGNTQHAVGRAARPAASHPVAGHSQGNGAPAIAGVEHKPRILFAEDSAFFRNKVKKFLEHEGWEVVACEDGAAAWNTLCDPQFDTDLLITDIEMPNLNGFELCDRVRHSGRWAQLPVIAVTSLAGDADRANGIQVGVTEYMVKLNRDELLSTVSRHLGVPLHAD
jgi:two-component system, chemotaxis family, sensor kinase CheA